MELDWEEFYSMQPKKIRDTHEAAAIRQWFDAADTDKSGSLSIDEFFLWSLGNAAVMFGARALTGVFERYDTNRTGMLDASEARRRQGA